MQLQHINLIPKNTENTTKAEIQSQITSKTTHSVKEMQMRKPLPLHLK